MNQAAPPGARCGRHPEQEALWTCGRCGTFFCQACERRVRDDAPPMCPSCWELRGKVVKQSDVESPERLQKVGMYVGFVALCPGCMAVQIASLVVNIMGLVKATTPEGKKKSKIGLACTGLGLVFTVIFFVVISSR